MNEDTTSNRFKGWPFIAEDRRSDGGINNGAFDLVRFPEKIDSIHEATDANGLRALLQYINRPDGFFMTLGCSASLENDGIYYSYLEFTVRHQEIATSTDWPGCFEKSWLAFLARARIQLPSVAQTLEDTCALDWRSFHLRPETVPRLLVCIYSRNWSEADHCIQMSHIQRFFELLESGELN